MTSWALVQAHIQNGKTIPIHFRRSQRIRSPKHYMSAQSTISQCYLLDAPNIVFEYMLNRLRIPDPVSFQSFTQQTQLNKEMICRHYKSLNPESLIKINEQGFHLFEQGWLFLDHCTERFYHHNPLSQHKVSYRNKRYK